MLENLAILQVRILCSGFTFTGGEIDNKVGDNVPKQQKLDAIMAQLISVIKDLTEFCVTLHSDDRSSLLHPRRGGEAKVEFAADLCTRYDVKLKNVPVDGMLNDLRLARQIRPFIALLQSALTLVQDTSSQAQSEYWQAFLALYGALVKTSEHDAMLAAEVDDLIKFMATNAKRATPPEAAPAALPGGGEPPPK